MIKRPSRNDSEKDILEMQDTFLKEASQNTEFEPAAKLVRIHKEPAKTVSQFAKKKNVVIAKSENVVSNEEPSWSPIIGNIVERKIGDEEPNNDVEMKEVEVQKPRKKSLFAKKFLGEYMDHSQIEVPLPEPVDQLEPNVDNIKNAEFKGIHDENVEKLKNMSTEEILDERKKLLQTLDPKLIEFLKSKHNQPNTSGTEIGKTGVKKQVTFKPDIATEYPINQLQIEEGKWLNFNTVEPDKMEWMKDITSSYPKINSGEQFEARFDWNGILLPYILADTNKDERELYLHGDDPHRPGYTLQELFRLARSNVVQQRLAAFKCIAGIIEMYNTGQYEQVLELPISKMFFLIRFGFDDNSPPMLEATSRAMGNLFYNEADEFLVDLLFETRSGAIQPVLTSADGKGASIEGEFNKLSLNHPAEGGDPEDNKDEDSDVVLAETDLMQCLLRTNILQRIKYILKTVQPNNTATFSCFKILIRIARTSSEYADLIINDSDLIKSLFKFFLPLMHQRKDGSIFYNYPQYLVLKLFRIIISYSKESYLKLVDAGINDVLVNYTSSRDDLNYNLIRVQTEAYRTLRVIFLLQLDEALFSNLLYSMRHSLDWAFACLKFEDDNAKVIRQHASALLALIAVGRGKATTDALIGLIMSCLCKWFHEATKWGIHQVTQYTLLANCLDAAMNLMDDLSGDLHKFYEGFLMPFLQSGRFAEICSNLTKTSTLISEYQLKQMPDDPLSKLNAVVFKNDSPIIILHESYPFYFLHSIFRFATFCETSSLTVTESQWQMLFNRGLLDYLRQINGKCNKELTNNWFLRGELYFILNLLRCPRLKSVIQTKELIQLAYQMLTSNIFEDSQFLMDMYLFDASILEAPSTDLKMWKQFYENSLRRLEVSRHELTQRCIKPVKLPEDWPFFPLVFLLDQHINSITTKQLPGLASAEKNVITFCFNYISLLQNAGLRITSPTEELIYLMIAFLGPQSTFLDEDVKHLLKTVVLDFFQRNKNTAFEFDRHFEGKSKFENLYTLFLEHFQAASYGDPIFGALVLVPLAQKYDVKWRKRVWSEHVIVMRFITSSEQQLLGSIDAYVTPVETDVSLLKNYAEAINQNMVRKTTVAYTIANHHLTEFKNRSLIKNSQ